MKWTNYMLIIVGILYIVDPNIFTRGKWGRQTALQRQLTPESYSLLMRVLGVAGIIWGLWPLLHHKGV